MKINFRPDVSATLISVGFSITPNSGEPPLTVAFDITSTTGQIDSYSWSFGDGDTFTGANPPDHTYEVDGLYTVILTVIGPSGSFSTSQVVVVATGGTGGSGDFDNIINAFPLIQDGLEHTKYFDNTGATMETNEATDGEGFEGVWATFNLANYPPACATVTFKTEFINGTVVPYIDLYVVTDATFSPAAPDFSKLESIFSIGDGTATPPEQTFVLDPYETDSTVYYLWIGDWNYAGEGVQKLTYTIQAAPNPSDQVLRADGRSGTSAAVRKNFANENEVWVTASVAFSDCALAKWLLNGFSQSANLLEINFGGDSQVIEGIYIGVFGLDDGWISAADFDITSNPPPLGEIYQMLELHYKADTYALTAYVDGTEVWSWDFGSGGDEATGITVGQSGSQTVSDSAFAYINDVKAGITRGGTEIFDDDFSSGDLSNWDVVNGAVDVGPNPYPEGGGPVTIDSPLAAATVTGIITLRGTMDISLPVGAVEVRYDAEDYRPASWRDNKWRTSFNTTPLSVGAHTLGVRVTYSDASITETSVPITVASSTMIPGVGALKLGSGFSGLATNKDKYTYFQINEGDAGALADVITRGTMALTWNHGTTVRKFAPSNTETGVSYDECAAKGWVQKTAGNADVEYPGDPNQVFVKFGDPNYIARVVDRFVNDPNLIADHNSIFLPGIFAQNAGIKGMMTDDTNASYSASGTTPSADYPTSVAWRNAMFLFLQGVGSGIQDAGYAYGCNPNSSSNEFVSAAGGWPAWGQAHDGSQLSFWVRAMAPYVDFIMCEFWMVSGYIKPVRLLGATAAQAFRENLANLMPAANETGTSWLMNLQVGLTADNGSNDTNLASAYNQARMIYLKAAFLLKWDPTTGSVCDLSVPPAGYSSTDDPWNASWTADVGLPLGDITEPQSGLFRREYVDALVLLNANNSGGTLSQDGHSLGPGEAFIG